MRDAAEPLSKRLKRQSSSTNILSHLQRLSNHRNDLHQSLIQSFLQNDDRRDFRISSILCLLLSRNVRKLEKQGCNSTDSMQSTIEFLSKCFGQLRSFKYSDQLTEDEKIEVVHCLTKTVLKLKAIDLGMESSANILDEWLQQNHFALDKSASYGLDQHDEPTNERHDLLDVDTLLLHAPLATRASLFTQRTAKDVIQYLRTLSDDANKCKPYMASLVEIVQESQNTIAARQASLIILDYMTMVLERPKVFVSKEDILRICSVLMDNEDQIVVQDTACRVCQWIQEGKIHVGKYIWILSSLASVLKSTFTNEVTKVNILRSILHVILQNKTYIQMIPRQPKLLGALVQSTREDSANATFARDILLRLANDVCNLRLLALESGLLSTLIHHARASDEAVKSQLKANVLRIASAL